jgi:hypothetical protein
MRRTIECWARNSDFDERARPHPEIHFVFDKDGTPENLKHAAGDRRSGSI